MDTHVDQVGISKQSVYELMSACVTGDEQTAEAVRQYIRGHLARFTETLKRVPRAESSGSRLLDVGGMVHMAPCYQQLLNYGEITVGSRDDSPFAYEMPGLKLSYFDAEFDRFPFKDGSFDTVVCLEVIEHLTTDPMRMMVEINRVCKPGGYVVLTTPNVIGWKVIARLLAGKHPSGWSYYSGFHTDRHNREYTPGEMGELVRNAGFDVTEISTFSQSGLQTGHRWLRYCVLPLKRFWELPDEALRGDYIYVAGRRNADVRERYPDWLYGGYREERERAMRRNQQET